MAQKQFPGSIEILDFFHLSEYVWKVAKLAYPKDEQKQKNWVSIQQNLQGKRKCSFREKEILVEQTPQ